ncbi:MAG: hypothetical protein IJT02_00705 [Synergistaceae bacterium]|nr:hypothetical protein [Synergistaceae bacterium]
MGKFFSKLRQVFNIFLLSALIAAVAALFIYFLTTPEQRGTTFWISVAFLGVAFVLQTLQAMGIAWRSNGGKNIPVGFSKLILGFVYFLFVIVMAVGNALYPFTTVKYLLIHVAGLAVFLVPMVLMNMAELKLSDATTRQQAEGREHLAHLAAKVGYIADDLKASDAAAQIISQVMRFSESILYSDPTPAGRKIERALEEAVEALEDAAKGKDTAEVQRACTLAERALRERNEAVLHAK